MGWLFGQVWVLCVIAFLAGSVVTWLAFGRALPVPPSGDGPVWTPVPAWASGRRTSAAPARPTELPPLPRRATSSVSPAPPDDPALSALDTRGSDRPRSGTTASGALDLLGETGPNQAGPEAGGPARG